MQKQLPVFKLDKFADSWLHASKNLKQQSVFLKKRTAVFLEEKNKRGFAVLKAGELVWIKPFLYSSSCLQQASCCYR